MGDGARLWMSHDCTANAVRMVKIIVSGPQFRVTPIDLGQHDCQAPLCAACAEFHERGSK